MKQSNLNLQDKNLPIYENIYIGESKFSDNIWDLSDLIDKKTLDKGRKTLDFSYIKSENLLMPVKMYAYHKFAKMKPQSVRTKIGYLAIFIKYAELNNIHSFSEITKEIFLDFNMWLKDEYIINGNRNKGKHVSSSYGYTCSYILQDIIQVGQILGWDVPKKNIFLDVDSSSLWQSYKDLDINKTKPIPDEIFSKILYYAVNKETNILTKAELIIQSQTGLRISEVLSIQEGCIKTTDEGHAYLEVIITKTEKDKGFVHKVFCNELVVKMVQELEDYTKELRIISNMKELFLMKSPTHKNKILVQKSAEWNVRFSRFIKKWDIRDCSGELCKIHSHQFRATFVRELIKNKIPMAYIMKHFNHVSIEMSAHYLTLKEDEVKEIYTEMLLSPDSKIAGLRAKEITDKLKEQFNGKTELEIKNIISNLSKSMSFNPLPTGVCLYDFRRGNCTDGDGCFFYNCPNYITEAKFYPVLKKELELMETEMTRLKELERERDWQRQYVKWQCLKPLVENLEAQINDQENIK